MTYKKVATAILLLPMLLVNNLEAQDKFFKAFSGVSAAANEKVAEHQQFLKEFYKKNFRVAENLNLYQEYIYQEWVNESWNNTFSEKSTIDTTGEVWIWTTEEFVFENGSWNNSHKFIVRTTPMSAGDPVILGSLSFVWVEGGWIEISKITYTYEGSQLKTVLIELAVEENTFIPFQLYSYEYGNLQLVSSETISDFIEDWVFVYRSEFDYSEEGRLKESREYKWIDNSWTSFIRTMLNYDSYDQLSIKTDYLYPEQVETPFRKTIYEYSISSGQLAFEQEYYWENNEWKHMLKKTYEYNSLELLTAVTTEEDYGSGFEFKYRDTYTYNETGLETEKTGQEYDGSAWQNKTRRLANYTISSVGEDASAPGEFRLFSNYPNPFNPSTIISYSLAADSRVTLKIFNVIGEEAAILIDADQKAGQHSVTFNASNLPSGIYLYQLNAGNISKTRKMLLLR